MKISKWFGAFGLCMALVTGCTHQQTQRPAAVTRPLVKQPCFGAPTGPYEVPLVCAPGVIKQVAYVARRMELVSPNNADEAEKFKDYFWGMKLMQACKKWLVFPQPVQDGMWLVFTRYLEQVQAKDSVTTDCSPELAALASLVPAPEGK